ncbi:MAG: hypothetical protein Q7S83_01885 [bacterium]|nr:hypothetical protein [bacterium]
MLQFPGEGSVLKKGWANRRGMKVYARSHEMRKALRDHSATNRGSNLMITPEPLPEGRSLHLQNRLNILKRFLATPVDMLAKKLLVNLSSCQNGHREKRPWIRSARKFIS